MKFRNQTFKLWELILIITMYLLCALCLITGILSLIFPESTYLKYMFPIFTIICIIEIVINALYRMYSTKQFRKKLQNAMEQVEVANESRNIFFANISHELRTPLNIMQGMNEMIIRESNVPAVSEYAKNSSIAGKNLERLVNNLIIYSRINTGLFSAIDFQFDLYDFLVNYTKTIRTSAKRHDFVFNHYISPAISRDTIGDNSLLGQLLDNIISIPLLINEHPTIGMSFSWDKKSDHEGNLNIHMEVPGLIIDEKSIYHLYDTTSAVNTINPQGTDFNFSIIKYILNAINGIIEISNNKDNGCNIYMAIPYKLTADSTMKSNLTSTQDKVPGFTAPDARILVVDDHKLNIDVIQMLLKRTDITVDSALNGYDALKLISAQTYNIILLDYMMPEMDGIELLNNIKDNYPDTYENTPIFALSASTNTEIIEKLMQSGFKGFIPKPIEGNILEGFIKDNLSSDLININYTSYDPKEFPHELIIEFRDILVQYDINIAEGLKYMSGDLLQYHMVAELIVKNYDKKKKNIVELHNKGNYKDLGIAVHALKGNARFVGASALYNIAMSIETRANRNETEFVDCALPLLYYQWEKSFTGIKLFLKKFNSLNLLKDNSNNIEQYDDDYLEKLMEYTDNFQPEPALKLIEHILKNNVTAEQAKKLNLAAQYLEDLEYDEAMNIFKEMLR